MAQCHNELVSLPPHFSRLGVPGLLSLYNNQLTTLPLTFGDLTVSGDLHLGNNRLLGLPPSSSSLRVGGSLYLQHNHFSLLAASPLTPEGEVTEGFPHVQGEVIQHNRRDVIDARPTGKLKGMFTKKAAAGPPCRRPGPRQHAPFI